MNCGLRIVPPGLIAVLPVTLTLILEPWATKANHTSLLSWLFGKQPGEVCADMVAPALE